MRWSPAAKFSINAHPSTYLLRLGVGGETQGIEELDLLRDIVTKHRSLAQKLCIKILKDNT